jgi:hypothetical protein
MPPSQHFALSSRSSPRLMRWRASPPRYACCRPTVERLKGTGGSDPMLALDQSAPARRRTAGAMKAIRGALGQDITTVHAAGAAARLQQAESGSLQGRRQQARRMTGRRVRNSPAADRFGHRGCPGRDLHHRDDDVRRGYRGSKCPRPGPHRIAARQAPSFLIPPVPLGSQSLAPGPRGRAREASASIDALDRRRELTCRRPLRPLQGRVKIASNNPMRDDDSESPK